LGYRRLSAFNGGQISSFRRCALAGLVYETRQGLFAVVGYAEWAALPHGASNCAGGGAGGARLPTQLGQGDRMTEQQRQRAIRLRLSRAEERRAAIALSTGFAALDAALGVGGLPRASIVELFGPSSSGKTTLALEIVAHAQKDGTTAAWIDAEHVFDAPYASRLGVVVEKLLLAQPGSAEEALEIVCRLAASGAVELLVVDSAAALVPRLELESAIGDGGAGLHSRVLASGLRRLAQVAAKSGAVVIFVNQTRSRMETPGGVAETTAGGAPLKLYASVRLSLEAQGGERVRFRVLKNKVAAAFREGELRLRQTAEFTESP
jgi:recombination protein RecA